MISVTVYEAIIYSSLLVPAVLPLFIAVLFLFLTCCKQCKRTCFICICDEVEDEKLLKSALMFSPQFTILLAKALKQLGMGEFEFEKEHQAKEQNDTEEGNRNNRYVQEDSTTVQDLERTDETELLAQGNDAQDNLFTNITIYGVRVPHTNQLAMLMSITILVYNMVSLFIYYAIVTKINASLACISGLDNCFWTNATTGLGISDTIKINCSDEDFISNIASEDVLCLGSINILHGLMALAGLVALIKTANGIYILLAVKVVSKVALRLYRCAKQGTWCIAICVLYLHSILLYGVFVALIIFGLSRQIALTTRIEWLAVLSTLSGVFATPWYNLRIMKYILQDIGLKPEMDMNRRRMRRQYHVI